MKKKWTGERLERFVLTRDTVDHLHRYAVALNYVEDKIVLDIASGEGYGSALIAEKAVKVFGVDIDAATIENAKKRYVANNLEFQQGSTSNIPLPNNSVDVVISFETIEHHDQHEEMMSEIKRVLNEDGLLIISSPDKEMYSDRRSFNNPFHIKELYKQDFENLVQFYFSETQFLLQSFVNGNSIIVPSSDSNCMTYTGNYDDIEKESTAHMYILGFASNKQFTPQSVSIFDGSSILADELVQFKKAFYASRSYRLGNLILKPLKKIKSLLK